eukprot:CAMPEP_0172487212 /NCGR_PEP_ID=MMETSP1066-20121228/16170_1 /TAXON_ID=671091 /ORGANISM="Coscinodiscus wailesii, Strain CCMP2513" /LENGTH=203 /DNA_ID=CAMNT_0013253667 /DNA_START=45 /DNA_END=652 /DNA_ORIENTATION=+
MKHFQEKIISFRMSLLLAFFLLLEPLHSSQIHTFPLLHHNALLRRRLRRLADTEQEPHQLAPLWEGFGTHYVDLWIGHPNPQRQTVIVDTGSQLTAFPCKGCNDCGTGYHTDEYFDFSVSDTFKKKTCHECVASKCDKNYCRMGLHYQEGSSWSAFEAVDRCYAGGSHVTSVTDEAKNEIDDPAMNVQDYTFDLTFGCQSSIT